MKKLILLVCAAALSLGTLAAQNSLGGHSSGYGAFSSRGSDGSGSGLFVNLGVGYGFGYETYGNYDGFYEAGGLALDACVGYLFAINQRVAVGVGTGINLIGLDGFFVPKLFSQTKFTIPMKNNLSFVGSLNIGVAVVDFDYPSFLVEPSIGISKNHWTYSVKYSPCIYDDGSDSLELYAFTLNFTYKF